MAVDFIAVVAVDTPEVKTARLQRTFKPTKAGWSVRAARQREAALAVFPVLYVAGGFILWCENELE